MGLFDILNPIKGIIGGVTGLIDEITTTDEERLAAKAKLAVIEQAFTAEILEYEAKIIAEQASVIRAEVASKSWMARNWRPMLMLLFGYIILHNFVLAQMFSLQSLEIPPDMWGLLKLGIGGYIAGRSAEKIVPNVITALRSKQQA